MTRNNVTILGDSRTFDTYYLNALYRSSYGYDKTFPFLLRGKALAEGADGYDVVHIPDHFRAGLVENNVLRLALTDPALVVLCDGVWETLVNKEMFIEYALEKIRAHDSRSGKTLELAYSSRALADLFKANELPVSPARYAERQRKLISYFRRRRRHCLWMSLAVPDVEYLNRVHFAGNYRCIPEWGECLQAVNDAVMPIVEEFGATWLDIGGLMAENGGPNAALIDQWHFSESFHELLAAELHRLIEARLGEAQPSADHISHDYMLARELGAESVVVYGIDDAAGEWLRSHPDARVEAVAAPAPEVGHFHSIRTIAEEDLARTESRIVLVTAPEDAREPIAARLLGLLPEDKIILYPQELGQIVNPSPKGAAARDVNPVL